MNLNLTLLLQIAREGAETGANELARAAKSLEVNDFLLQTNSSRVSNRPYDGKKLHDWKIAEAFTI